MVEAMFWDSLEQNMPAVFPRSEVGRLTGFFISSRTMANLDSQGLGPKGKIRIGKKIGYSRCEFIVWLKSRCVD